MPTQRLKQVLNADLAVNWKFRGVGTQPNGWSDIVRSLADVRFLPVAMLRVASCARRRGDLLGKIVFLVVSLANRMWFGVECAAQTEIGPGLYFPHTGGIVIGATRIGSGCVIYHQVTLGAQTIDMPFTPSLRPMVGDDVVLSAGSKVLGGVYIGDGAIVAANAVVTKDVVERTVVGGVPATLIKKVEP
jgi:serine O-acetyltransferase